MKWTRLLHEPALQELFSTGNVGERLKQIERLVFDRTTAHADRLELIAERDGIRRVLTELEKLAQAEEAEERKRTAATQEAGRNGQLEAWGLPTTI